MMTTTTFYIGMAAIVLGHLAVALVNCWMIHRDYKANADKGNASSPEGAVDANATTFDASMVEEQEEVRA